MSLGGKILADYILYGGRNIYGTYACGLFRKILVEPRFFAN